MRNDISAEVDNGELLREAFGGESNDVGGEKIFTLPEKKFYLARQIKKTAVDGGCSLMK